MLNQSVYVFFKQIQLEIASTLYGLSWSTQNMFTCQGLNKMSQHFANYRKTSNIRCTIVGNKIVDHSDVVGASPVGSAPTTSSFST